MRRIVQVLLAQACCLFLLVGCMSEQQKLKRDIKQLQTQIESDTFGLDLDSMRESVISMRKSYLVIYPTDTAIVKPYLQDNITQSLAVPNYELAEESILQYIHTFPNDPKLPELYFILGLEVYEKGMKANQKAAATFQSILEDFPNHQIIPDVLFALEVLGKSDAELMEMLN